MSALLKKLTRFRAYQLGEIGSSFSYWDGSTFTLIEARVTDVSRGFRATVFHLGAIQRLNELGVLARLSTITSVSGGSILNGVLATRWSRLKLAADGRYSNLREEIGVPVRDFCAKDLRTPILVGTRLNPINWGELVRDGFSVSANFLADGYARLYDSSLADIPAPSSQVPRFIFCATNVRTGACWHFHAGPEARMGDFYTGYCDARWVRVSEAVAASSAFPPAFSAFRLRTPKDSSFSRDDPWGEFRVVSSKRSDEQHGVRNEPVFLTDGGIYDNLAVEPVWDRYRMLLVSDAGRPFQAVRRIGQALIPRLLRVAEISMEQVRAVRQRWLVADFQEKKRIGAIWTLHTRLEDFPITDARGYGKGARELLKRVRTDLDGFSDGEIACLENHGYSIADAALRSRAPGLCPKIKSAFEWPHEPWRDEEKLAKALAESARRRIARDAWRSFFTRP
ncbi:MAG: patatin-like phospholipase family protein [Gemmataceae bacterium]|nr:patatin-like phospholipase family protein [Gemmataceae bacterium]